MLNKYNLSDNHARSSLSLSEDKRKTIIQIEKLEYLLNYLPASIFVHIIFLIIDLSLAKPR